MFDILYTEVCSTVVHKGHLPLPPAIYAPNEIRNNKFLPLMGAERVDAKTCFS